MKYPLEALRKTPEDVYLFNFCQSIQGYAVCLLNSVLQCKFDFDELMCFWIIFLQQDQVFELICDTSIFNNLFNGLKKSG